ncbi:MAG: ATP-binding cassette domain-containing protein [Cytophagales bacterium]|nr:MAG: ATP-binding cassette domain-containing protein [Cytophagales bacterium]
MKHLKKVIINNFFKRNNNIIWDLETDVNVLVGINGSGKTTILNMIMEALKPQDSTELNYDFFSKFSEDMEISFVDDEIIKIDTNFNKREPNDLINELIYLTKNPVILIQTFNVPVNYDGKTQEIIKELTKLNPKTTLDYELGKYIMLFESYKKDIDNEISSAILNNNNKNTEDIINLVNEKYADTKSLYSIINDFFGETNKSINDKKEPFYFHDNFGDTIYTELSSGEKQLLLLLLVVFLQRKQDSVLLLDEPEISLHLSWQRKLIDTLRKINPNCQLIIVTHSPSIYGDGWIASRRRISGEGAILFPMVEEIPSVPNTTSQAVVEDGLSENLRNSIQAVINNYERNFDRIYRVNLRLKEELSFNLTACKDILQILKENKLSPDQITLGTMIGRIDSFESGKNLLSLYQPTTKNALLPFVPNEIALNQLLKKATNLDEALNFVETTKQNPSYNGINFPDIITFSTLLGKIRTAEAARIVEEKRNYFGISANPQYLAKLQSLLRQA